VSEPGEPETDVPQSIRAGVWANDVDVYGDIEELTLDFVRLDPRDVRRGIVVARVVASRWCILKLKKELESR
jgi:hypothetical protein